MDNRVQQDETSVMRFHPLARGGDDLRLEFRHTFSAPREVVWSSLQDEQVLRRSLPGCRKLVGVAEGAYDAELGLNVGPVKGVFTGEVKLSELREPESYRLTMSGKGKPGEIRGDARIRLEEAERGTLLVCDAEAQVTGVLASVGQRVMASVAKLILGQFFKAVEREIQGRHPVDG
jgi:carbon monoxide dehydrogenase subunit G